MSTRWNPQKPTHTHTHTHTGKPCQIIKQIGTICLMLISFFVSPTFATEINNPATCDNGTLSTDTGPTNLRANYESNTLNLKWYDDNGNQLNVQNESNSCTYGGSINLPTPPTKRGYTFKGWKVAIYDFSTFDATINGDHRHARGVNISNNTDVCHHDGYIITCNVDFSDLGRYQWKTSFSYGTIYGNAMCSTVPGSYAVTGNPINDSGKYCWCRAISYKNNDIIYSPTSNFSWVFSKAYESASACASNCAASCSGGFQSYVGFRRAIFGVTQ